MRFGWSPGGSAPEPWPSSNKTNYTTAAAAGWTHGLEKPDTYNGFCNAYLLPVRGYIPAPVGPNPGAVDAQSPMGFLTKGPSTGSGTGPEAYYYAVEIQPVGSVNNPQQGPRNAPVVDDLEILYMPSIVSSVLQESWVVFE